MKKSLFARGFMGAVASLLGVCAVGCSAEGVDDGQVASQSQNLGNAAPSSTITGFEALPSARVFAASCVINQNGQDKLVVAGGFDSSGTASDDIYVYDPTDSSDGHWTLLDSVDAADKLQHARGLLKGIQTESNKCVFVGGQTAETSPGTVYGDVDELVANADGSFTVNNRTALNLPRSNFALTTCGSKLVVIGGYDDTTPATLRSIEVAPSLAPTSAWTNYNSAGTGLNTARKDFAFVKDPNGDQYLVAGGLASAGGRLDTLETITMSSCAPTSTVYSSGGGVTRVLSTAVDGPVAFFEGTTDKFIVAGGRSSATGPAIATAYRVDVTWGTPTISVSDANAADLPVATFLPTVVKSYSGTHIAHMVLGGSDADTNPTSADLDTIVTNGVQQYQQSYGWHSANLANLSGSDGRFGPVAELVDGVVLLVGGRAIAGGVNSFPTEMEGITP